MEVTYRNSNEYYPLSKAATSDAICFTFLWLRNMKFVNLSYPISLSPIYFAITYSKNTPKAVKQN